MKELILVGGGGHCQSVIDVVQREGRFAIRGILDSKERLGHLVSGYEIIGGDEEMGSLVETGCHFLVAIGQIKSAAKRIALFKRLTELGGLIATPISPFAVVSKNAKIGRGTIVMHGAIVNAGAEVRENCIINTHAIIEHGAIVGDHCHISTGAVVNGDCRIGNGVFVGSKSVIVHSRKIAEDSVVGAGAVITRDIDAPGGTWVGSPARRISA